MLADDIIEADMTAAGILMHQSRPPRLPSVAADLVLVHVVCEVLLQVHAQRVPEQFPAGQCPGQRVHQTVAVAVRVDRYQTLLAVIGLETNTA